MFVFSVGAGHKRANLIHFVMSRFQFPVSRLKLQPSGGQFSEFEVWMINFGDEFELPLQFRCDLFNVFALKDRNA